MTITVSVYQMAKGKTPFLDWLGSLKDRRARARIRVRLDKVRMGNFGDCKSVGGGVNEFKIDYGPGYRVYYGKRGSNIVVLLAGGTKKGQEKDIKKAIEYWKDFKSKINN